VNDVDTRVGGVLWNARYDSRFSGFEGWSYAGTGVDAILVPRWRIYFSRDFTFHLTYLDIRSNLRA
jgi:hypothetical protein